ncbi:MAG TPA: MATE family efflux transporter [Acetivibrio sp.]|nr:MATE family efflux transporter [Clostridium sp.]HOQ38154.1 MATE family efflux transporter [Acetivibrio sp.]HPT90925.1 MATE family efflux transporter [Acetivibrio sp.]HQA58838.1 MATE family efflux transporter [Acetivibrio sp.]
MKEELFEKYSVPKAVMTLALPTILGMLVTVFYNMADTFFVGKTNDPNQMASVVLIFPVFMILMAFGNIFGIGGGSYISRLLGLKEHEKVKSVSSFCFYACIFVGIVIGLLLLLFMDGVLILSGSTENTYDFARSYMIIVSIGTPFICLQQALGQIIRAEGAARSAMVGMMIGTVVNIILDPIMILSMGMGVVGAAVATVIGNICSVVYYIYYLTKKTTVLSIALKKFKMTGDIIFNILVIGIPVFVNNMLFSVANLIFNNFASDFGEIVVSSIGIPHRINSLPVMVMIGLSQGIQPFIGYNYAAKNYKRMNGAIKFSTACSVIFGTVTTLVFFFAAEPLVGMFIKNSEIIEMGSLFFKIFIIPIPILGIQFIFMNTFQAIGKAIPALVLSICRQGLAFIPALIIGKRFFGLDGVIWAQPVADLITIAISIVLYITVYGMIKREVSIKEELLAAS